MRAVPDLDIRSLNAHEARLAVTLDNRTIQPGRRKVIGRPLLSMLAVLLWTGSIGCGRAAGSGDASARALSDTADSLGADEGDASDYEGVDSRGIPHYAAARTFFPEEADILRRAYGVAEPHRLYVSDSTEDGILKYDTKVKPCRTCYVNSYRVGYVSVRRPGESWEQAEQRVRATPSRAFSHSPHPGSTSLDDLDPTVRPFIQGMLRDARARGFRIRVSATYRSPVREAFLMSLGKGRTHTLTSSHSYGRAVDVVVDDGNRRHAATKRDWIAFRRWVSAYRGPHGESFRILGQVDRTWDWAHVEVPSAQMGFGTIEEAVARGRACLAPAATVPCNFPPHLPERLKETLVQ